ncbi:MAG: Hsp20/alpha crystallin family protein [Thermoplasmatales archaeon]|nr:MAG: Hsp20/alpha crystallin family protein [Thermoplasmatales archaeon]
MDPFNEDKDKRRKNPFDFIDDDEFERIFDEIQKMFESTNFKKLFEEMLRGGFDTNKSFVRGLSFRVGPDGKPKIQEFGNRPTRTEKGHSMISEEREPLTDIIEGKNDVAITIEIPGVEKDDIDLNIKEDTLEIKVNTPQRKYHKVVDIPCNVKPKTTKATYKNGILDIVLEKKDKGKGETGYKVSIK